MYQMRLLPVGLVALTSSLMACTDPGPSNSSSSSSGGDFNGITGSLQDTFWSKNGDVSVYRADRWSAVEAIADKSYPGKIDDAGNFTIADVPTGPYWLVLTGVVSENFPTTQAPRSYIETDARGLELGLLFTARSDIAPMTQPSAIAIDATFSTPFQTYTEDMNGMVIQPLTDEVQFVSRGAGLWGVADSFADGTGPVDGVSQVQGWTFDMQTFFQSLIGRDVPLVDAAKGDDFVMIHGVAATDGDMTPDGDPWTGNQYYAAHSASSNAAVTMVDGAQTNVVADFTALPQKNFALDYKGSAFNALIQPEISTEVSVSLSVIMEAGAPNPGAGTFANLLSVNVSSELTYSNPVPVCQGADCNVVACGTPCDPGMFVRPGDYAHAYTYGNPFTYGQELFSGLITFSHNVRSILPEMTNERLRGYLGITIPAAEVSGKPIEPTLSFPQNIKVSGQTTNLDQITTGVGTTPTVSWDAPSIGTPTKYRVVVIDLTDLMGVDGGVSSRRTVATMETKKTQVTIPAEIMKTGTNYYFQVTAYAGDAQDPAKPYVYAQHEVSARMFTGVVTP